MKKIGFCIDSLEMGGAEKLLVDIINALSETKEYEISVLTKYKSNSYFYNLIKNKINYFYLIDKKEKDFFLIKLKNSIVKKLNFKKFLKNADIIIDFLDGDFCKYIAKNKNREKIIWLHSNYESLKLRKNIERKINNYDKIVVICDALQKEIAKKTYKIYNFIDYSFIDKKLNEKLEIKFNLDEKYFLTVCRLNEEQKDVRTLIEAFSKYKGEEKLIIVGDGPDRERLEQLTKEKKIENKVIFLGQLTNPFTLMKNAEAFILSSKTEGFGLVLVEALYCGTKVISADCPVGPREILKNGEIGELFEVGDTKKLLEKMITIKAKEYKKEKIIEQLKKYEKENFIKNFRGLVNE